MNRLTCTRNGDNILNKMKIVTRTRNLLSAVSIALCLLLQTGCKTAPPAAITQADQEASKSINLVEGDTVKITFPNAPVLNTAGQVRRDGKISIPSLGEVNAVGLTPADLEKEIVKRYGDQLVSKEVTVSLERATFPVFVSGAVLRPGKISSDRPISALDAIMEAGGFDRAKANLKEVTIIRHDEQTKKVKKFTIDLQSVLDGKKNDPFFLQPSDIVVVPEKFTLF